MAPTQSRNLSDSGFIAQQKVNQGGISFTRYFAGGSLLNISIGMGLAPDASLDAFESRDKNVQGAARRWRTFLTGFFNLSNEMEGRRAGSKFLFVRG